MKDFLRQNGILLLVIALMLSILIGIVSFVMGGQADPFSDIVNTVSSPVRGGIAAAADWLEGAYNYVFHYSELEAELEALRAQVGELEEKVRQGEEASRENDQLRELLELQTRRRDLTTEPAKVTARSTSSSNWESTLTLSKGTSAGIEAGDCVITQTGALVGVVRQVGINWSTVSTVIDTETEIGGIVMRTYSAGVLEGSFDLMDRGRLKLNYLPEGAQLVSGDEVLTSGRGDMFPSGLVVGRVEGVFTDPSGQTRYAIVEPAVTLDSLIEVFVIKDFEIVE